MIDNTQLHRMQVMWLDVTLALVAGCYLLIGFHVSEVGDLQTGEQPATIIYIATGRYLLGGLLILLRHC